MRFRHCLLIFSLFLTSCEPFINSRGNVVAVRQFESFVEGRTTMEEVLESCGTPSLHKDNFTWIYLGGKSEETSFRGVEMKDRTVIRLTFDVNRILKHKEIIHPLNDAYNFDEEATNLISNTESEAFLRKPND